jgi:hypothetical protein
VLCGILPYLEYAPVKSDPRFYALIVFPVFAGKWGEDMVDDVLRERRISAQTVRSFFPAFYRGGNRWSGGFSTG